MLIKVKLFATLRRFAPVSGLPGTPFEVDMPPGATIGQLAQLLQLPPEETKVAFVNGRAQELDFVLSPGDELGIFPPVGGG